MAPNIPIGIKIKDNHIGKAERRLSDPAQVWLIEPPHWLQQFVASGKGIAKRLDIQQCWLLTQSILPR